MAIANAVWGIEVGQCALKALKLRLAEQGKVELAAFDLIEHPKILSQPDADPDELVRAALEKFISRNDWQGDAFIIGVPGQQTFARFCKLPPVEIKKIPEIVRFEASQQIPFDMEDVVWDYQVFQTEDTPDVEVGIFAMRKDLIRKHLDHFGDVGIGPMAIQTIPSALYNFCRFDAEQEIEEDTATVVIDVGAQHTDLIVVEPNSAWSRNIPLGGNSFTEALVKAFKLSFAKAENLKRTAATSKYARQIFQAMRPVFADLVAEIQRSIGFYSSTHRDVELRNVLACGNAFHLPGLQKYLENNLTIAGGVRKLEKFNALLTSATANAPQFTDNILSFAPAYGLALQGLGLATISASLLPPELARIQLWKRKRPLFVAAAACLAIAAGFPWLRNWTDSQALAAGHRQLAAQAKAIVEQAKKYQKDFQVASTDTSARREKIDKLFTLQKDRAVIPRILALVHEAMPQINPPELAAARTPEEVKQLIESDKARFKRSERRQIIVEKLDIKFAKDIDAFQPEGFGRAGASDRRTTLTPRSSRGMPFPMGPGRGRVPPRFVGPLGYQEEDVSTEEVSDGAAGFCVSLAGRLLYGEEQSEAVKLISEEYFPELRRRASAPDLGFYIPAEDATNPARDKANLRFEVVPFGGAAGARMTRATTRLRAMVAPPPTETQGEETVVNPDPVTGEEMSSDWNFRLSFKIKLGEPPEPESGQPKEGE